MKKVKLIMLALLATTLISSCSKDDPQPDPNQVAYDNASSSTGGIMYDKFWSTEAGYDQSSANLATLNAKSDFFRCKQCHAWDGLGSTGSYINRAPKTSRPTVSSLNLYQLAQTKTSLDLFNAMKKTEGRRDIATDLSTYDPATPSTQVEGDKMPNYNELLTDDQIWDIVKFMKEGMFDVSNLYDATYSGTYPTGTATYSNHGLDGNEANGNAYYTANCAGCHGTDGKTISLEDNSLGKFVRSKPNEVQHKVHYGQLGSVMVGEFDISLSQMKDLYKAIANTTNFPD